MPARKVLHPGATMIVVSPSWSRCSLAMRLAPLAGAPAQPQWVRVRDPLPCGHARQIAEPRRREIAAEHARTVTAMQTARVAQRMGADQQAFPLGDVLSSRSRGAQTEVRRLARERAGALGRG